MQRSSNARGAIGGMANSSPAMTHSSVCVSSSKIDTSRTGRSLNTFADLPLARTKSVSTGCQQADCDMKKKASVPTYYKQPHTSTVSPPQQQPSSVSSASPNLASGEKRRVRFDPNVIGRVFDTTLHDLLNSWHTPVRVRVRVAGRSQNTSLPPQEEFKITFKS